MFEIGPRFSDNSAAPRAADPNQVHARRYNQAVNRFNRALSRGRLARFKKRLLRTRAFLYDLNVLKPLLSVRGASYIGIKAVEISRIIGTEGRLADFDIHFNPISERSRERWVNMAVAYQSYLPLGPVELIQVGDIYFVRDGHHRISVAHALGQIAIDAEVTLWKSQPPFPWQAEQQKTLAGRDSLPSLAPSRLLRALLSLEFWRHPSGHPQGQGPQPAPHSLKNKAHQGGSCPVKGGQPV